MATSILDALAAIERDIRSAEASVDMMDNMVDHANLFSYYHAYCNN